MHIRRAKGTLKQPRYPHGVKLCCTCLMMPLAMSALGLSFVTAVVQILNWEDIIKLESTVLKHSMVVADSTALFLLSRSAFQASLTGTVAHAPPVAGHCGFYRKTSPSLNCPPPHLLRFPHPFCPYPQCATTQQLFRAFTRSVKSKGCELMSIQNFSML